MNKCGFSSRRVLPRLTIISATICAAMALSAGTAMAQSEGEESERRSPTWRPQAPERPSLPDRPPAMERPQPTFDVSRPNVDLPTLELGSENIAAQPPTEAPAAEDEIPAVEEITYTDESVASEAEPEPEEVTEAVASEPPPAAQEPEATTESPAVADVEPARDIVADQPPVEVSTAAVTPVERESVLPEPDESLDVPAEPIARSEPAVPSAGTGKAGALVATHWVRPTYPRSAYRQGTEGWVKLRVTVDPAGQVADIALVESRPRGVFVREAVRAANQWEFEPLAGNLPQVNRSKVYQIDFTLNQ